MLFFRIKNSFRFYADFPTYYVTAKDFLSHKNIYIKTIAQPFNMPPFAMLGFIPLSIFFLENARIIFFIFSFICLLVTAKCFNVFTKINFALIIFILINTYSIDDSIFSGNISIYVNTLTILSFTIYFKSKHKEIIPGILLGLAIAIKMYPAIFVIMLLLIKKYKFAIYSCLSAFVFTLITFLIRPQMTFDFLHTLPNILNGKLVSPTGHGSSSLNSFFPSSYANMLKIIFISIVIFYSYKLFKKYNNKAIIYLIPLWTALQGLIQNVTWAHHISLILLIIFINPFKCKYVNYIYKIIVFYLVFCSAIPIFNYFWLKYFVLELFICLVLPILILKRQKYL